MKNKSNIEYDFTISQVESHLIFGPISRHIPFWYLLFAFYIAFLVDVLFSHSSIFAGTPVELFEKINSIFVVTLGLWFIIYKFRKQTLRQQAILGWVITKITLGVVAFIFMVMGPINMLRGDKEGAYILLLGIIWFPALEFIPPIVSYQKFITLIRIFLSIPCIYFIYLIEYGLII